MSSSAKSSTTPLEALSETTAKEVRDSPISQLSSQIAQLRGLILEALCHSDDGLLCRQGRLLPCDGSNLHQQFSEYDGQKIDGYHQQLNIFYDLFGKYFKVKTNAFLMIFQIQTKAMVIRDKRMTLSLSPDQ